MNLYEILTSKSFHKLIVGFVEKIRSLVGKTPKNC